MSDTKLPFIEENPAQPDPEQERIRAEYRARLAEKLKDPEFRAIDGFPIGTDEAILALSDPPYYTACPNPFIKEWLDANAKAYDPATDDYHREPFAADVTEGKSDPIYSAHSYHTKVPHKAIMRYILHYTEPGDVIYDGFCGTGMTGVAAQVCGDRAEVESLGHRVLADGTVLDEVGKPFSRLGARKAVLNDLGPAATFIAYNYNMPVDITSFEREAKRILADLDAECGWMYGTPHGDGDLARINYVVWGELFACPSCSQQFNFAQEALDPATKRVNERVSCPHCRAECTKDSLTRAMATYADPYTGETRRKATFGPVLVNYGVHGTTHERSFTAHDEAVLTQVQQLGPAAHVPTQRFPIEEMYHGSRLAPKGYEYIHDLYTGRALRTLAALWSKAQAVQDARLRHFVLFAAEQTIWGMSLLNRYSPTHYSQVNRYLSGVYYVSSMIAEVSPWYILDGKVKRLAKAFSGLGTRSGLTLTTTGSCDTTVLPPASVDFIFTDPPFGENIYYADLNFLVESWHGVTTNAGPEAIIDQAKKKQLVDYQERMTACFAQYYRALKPGRWMTVEFHNSANSVWNAIQEGLERVGFVVADVRILSKEQRSYRQVTADSTAQKDLVISCYKPRDEFAERFRQVHGEIDGVVEFIRQHLGMLPVAPVTEDGQIETVAERTRFVLFDRMLAFHLQQGARIPLSAAEFNRLLVEQFVARDEMVFLPEQAARYDALKARGLDTEQLSIFVKDEKSGVQWIRGRLTDQPRSQGDLTPLFMLELREWDSHEPRPELSDLLREYFVVENGIWRVPDPDSERDIEAMRRSALLRQFRTYTDAKAPLKVFRKEAVLEGFRYCWETNQYAVIVALCEKIPAKVLQEVHELVQFYDIARSLAPQVAEQLTFVWE